MMDFESEGKLTGRLLKLRRHVRWIAVGTALSGLAALLISLCQAKIYRATTYVLVSESKVGPAVPVPAWQVALLPTYIPFIDNEGLAARAIQHFQLDQEPYRLTPHKFHSRGYLDVEIPKSTRLIEISVEFPDAKLAAALANYLAATAIELNSGMSSADTAAGHAGEKTAEAALANTNAEIGRVSGEVTRWRNEIDRAEQESALAREAYEAASRDYRNAFLNATAKSQDLKQLAPAMVPERPTRPRTLLNVLLALLLGAPLLSAIALAIESLREAHVPTRRFDPAEEIVGAPRS